MKIDGATLDVLKEGMPSEATFTFAATAKTFEIMYGSLYSDKIRAILRELGTNAADSHIAAGKYNLPFEVSLPNSFDSHFSVRDFGRGMNEKTIRELYTCFGASDKVESNDYTGCLGLGSKSPLGYTDNFTVTSFFEGRKSIYNCFLNTNGIPAIIKMSDGESSEPSGVEIRFAVLAKDFLEFHLKSAIVYSWFSCRPIVKGVPDFTFKEREYLVKTVDYGVLQTKGKSYAIMGNVDYPLVSSEFNYNDFTDIERSLIDYGVDVFLPIGCIDFAASREKIRITDKTKINIKKSLTIIEAGIVAELEKRIENCADSWDARCTLVELLDGDLPVAKLFGKKQFFFKGKRVLTCISLDLTTEKGIISYHASQYGFRNKYKRHKNGLVFSQNNTLGEIPVYRQVTIFVNDVHGGINRIRKWMELNEKKSGVYVFNQKDQPDDIYKLFKHEEIDHLILKASDLPIPERSKGVSINGIIKKTEKAVVLNINGIGNEMSYWHDKEVDLDAGGIYVDVQRFKWAAGTLGEKFDYRGFREGDNYFTLPKALADLTRKINDFCGNPTTIIGIRQGLGEKLDKNKWIRLDDYIKQLAKSNIDLLDEVGYINLFNSLPSTIRRTTLFVNEKFNKNSIFGNFVNEFKVLLAAKDNKKAHSFGLLLETFGDFVGLKPTTHDNQKIYNKYLLIDEKYSLLKRLGNISDAEGIKEVAEYIKVMDYSATMKRLQIIKAQPRA